MTFLHLKDIEFSFPGKKLFEELDLSVWKGQITVIMGPSGCGKSSLLSMIGGRLVPSAGSIEFDGELVKPADKKKLYCQRRKMGMLFQSSALLTDLSVFENVAFPVREHTDLPEDIIRLIVLIKLEMVGLRGAAHCVLDEAGGAMLTPNGDVVRYNKPDTLLNPWFLAIGDPEHNWLKYHVTESE